jgi:hypothetical protein
VTSSYVAGDGQARPWESAKEVKIKSESGMVVPTLL